MRTEGIILVGGLGTRLRPLTDTCPKPMLPVAGVPLVERQLRRLRDVGIDRVVLATSYRAEVFWDTYGDGSGLGMSLAYSFESEPLGTGGAIRCAADLLSAQADDVVVLNGDILSRHSIGDQVSSHRRSGASVTLHTRDVDPAEAHRFGTVLVEGQRVQAFLEKLPEPVSTRINAGCYVFSREALFAIRSGQVVSVERDTFPALISNGKDVRVYHEQADWIDVGTIDAYERANRDYAQEREAAIVN